MADLTLHYAPRTRSFTALWLLEELGVPYDLESFPLHAGLHKKPAFLKMNPMGKVPVVVDRDVVISELGAIAIYLSDRYPKSRLAPPTDDRLRADYLRWCFFASAIIEPAFGQKFFNWKASPSTIAWGSFEQMLEVASAGTAAAAPWLLGDRFTAADVLVASGLGFGIKFGIVPKTGPIAEYVTRCEARDAWKRADAIEKREGERFPAQG